MRWIWLCVVGWALGGGGCDSDDEQLPNLPPAPDAAVDAAPPVDAPAICDPLQRFDPPMPLAERSTTQDTVTASPSLTADELSLYLDSGGSLYAAHRSALTETFGPPNLLPVVNSGGAVQPAVSADQLELWFTSGRATNSPHLYVTRRGTTADDFLGPVLDPNVNASSTDADSTPFLTADGTQLWFSSTRSSANFVSSIWYATREGRSFTTPRQEPAFAQGSFSNPVLSADRLTIYVFGGLAPSAVWRSHRETTAAAFPAPVPVNELAMAGYNVILPGWLSADGCRLYFTAISSEGFQKQIFVATRHP